METTSTSVLSCIPLNKGQESLLQEHFKVYEVEDMKTKEDRDKIVAMTMFPDYRVTEEILDLYPNLKVISACSVGYEHIDLQAAKKRGIRVGNTPDVLNTATAEIAIAHMLTCARRVVEADAISKDPEVTTFRPYIPTFLGTDMFGATVGIIGMGRIGSIVARMAHFGFSMNIVYHNRSPVEAELEAELKAQHYPNLNDMLGVCDFVVLTAPSTPETHRMMSKKEFSCMKKTAIFVNVSRGVLVDHDALVEALTNGVISYAGLDVTDPEPLPRNHALLKMKNVVITPHSGSSTEQTRLKMIDCIIGNIQGALQNKPMVSEVKCQHFWDSGSPSRSWRRSSNRFLTDINIGN